MFLLQIYDESNILQDGTLIDLCGATLLWRSSEGLQHSPVFCLYLFIWGIYKFLFVLFNFRQNAIWKN